jgi:hypothetical protein
VKELVKAGAKIDQPDKSDKTPIDYARNNKEIREVHFQSLFYINTKNIYFKN